jgi:predicted metallo-beta-lactamase superfamily hydrolase
MTGVAMEIEILAAESLGVRSMATLIRMPGRTILIDPGVALGTIRYGLAPHPLELLCAQIVRNRILSECQEATDIIFSHYHGDHIPMDPAAPYQVPLSGFATRPDVRFWCKGPEKLSGESKKRQIRLIKHIGKNLLSSEGLADQSVACSRTFPHGTSSGGGVMMTRVSSDDQVFVHASDTQCLPSEAVRKIIDWHPDIVYIAGPPLYLPVLSREECARAFQHISLLARNASCVIVDHHLLRSPGGWQRLDALSKATEGRICPAARFMGVMPIPLEAYRNQIHERYPPSTDDWRSLLAAIQLRGLGSLLD